MGEMFLKGAWLYDWSDDEEFATTYWDGTSECMYALGNSTWVTFPMWLRYVTAHNPGIWPKFSTTLLALNHTAEDLQVCNDMLKNNYDFIRNRGGMFEYRMSNYLYGFL